MSWRDDQVKRIDAMCGLNPITAPISRTSNWETFPVRKPDAMHIDDKMFDPHKYLIGKISALPHVEEIGRTVMEVRTDLKSDGKTFVVPVEFDASTIDKRQCDALIESVRASIEDC